MSPRIPPEVLTEIRNKGQMTVPFEHRGIDFGMVTVEADDVGLKVVNISSNDAAMRRMVIGMYVLRFDS